MRGTRVRFYPRRRQREYLAHAFGVGRFVWNWALATKRDAYQKDGITVSFAELSRRLTALRSEKTWLTDVDRQLQTQSLRDLDRAYENFFAKRARFPRFKSRYRPQRVRFVMDGRHAGKVRAWKERKLAHKHDAHLNGEETVLEETYYPRLNPPQGFAMQRVYTDDRSLDEAVLVEDGDVVMVPKGYHPVGAAHGYELYYLNVMAGPERKWIFRNDP